MNERHFDVKFRRDSTGGYVVDKPGRSAAAFAPKTRLFLLVHGFSVSEPSAKREYEQFKDTILDVKPALAGQIGYVIWPGDYGSGFGKLLYSRSVGKAIACASALGRYIRDRTTPNGGRPEIVLVAHSLGCRLVIDALASLGEHERRSVKVVLMAAAYPVNVVRGRPAVISGTRSFVAHSRWDRVLRFAFPPGETLARTSGRVFPEAVGLCGLPDGVWTQREEMSGYYHGDYWRNDYMKARISRFLGFSTSAPLATRQLPGGPIQERDLSGREMDSRDSPN